MNIGIDMMGGDYAPLEAVKGIQLYQQETNATAHLTLIGDEAAIKELLAQHKVDLTNITVIHASQMIEMQDHPTKALKEKPQ